MTGSPEARVFLVDLDQQLEGYRRFLSTWVYQSDDLTFIVDPGPRSTAGRLAEELRARGVDRLDFVLLSHIHLDHGGGSAEILEAFPGARLWCHPKGVKHLQSPEKLWQGTMATIGEVADTYGEPRPVQADRMASDEDLSQAGIDILLTPGHAPHHASFLVGSWLFAGEAVVTRVRAPGGSEFLRPATPPRFVAEVFFASLRKLEELDPEPEHLAFAHYGVTRHPADWCRRAGRQLELWCSEVESARKRGDPYRPEILVERLMKLDPDFATINRLDDDIRQRELFYVHNSLNGIWKSFDS